MNAHPAVILASQSPRRKELLDNMGVTFQVVPSDFEEHLDHSRPVSEVAIELALGKAREVAKRYPDAVIIGADTIVFVDGQQLGKPKDESEARTVLANLAGKANEVTTGLVVLRPNQGSEFANAFTTKVFFKPYNKDIHETYLASGDWHDKAGAYGIQSGAAPLVDYIDGDYDTILGLPTKQLSKILQSFGISSRPAIVDHLISVRKVQ